MEGILNSIKKHYVHPVCQNNIFSTLDLANTHVKVICLKESEIKRFE